MLKEFRIPPIKRKPIQWTSKMKISVVFGIISFVIGIVLIYAASELVACYRDKQGDCDFPDKGGPPDAPTCASSRGFVVAGAFGLMAALLLVGSFGAVCYQHFIGWIGFHFLALCLSALSAVMLLMMEYVAGGVKKEGCHDTDGYVFLLGALGMAWFWSLVSSGIFIGLTMLSPNPKYDFFKIPSRFRYIPKRNRDKNRANPSQFPVNKQQVDSKAVPNKIQVDPKAAPNKVQVAPTPTPIPKLSPKPKG